MTFSFRPYACAALALGLILLSGCEDPDARLAGSDAGKKVADMRARIDALEKKAEDNALSLRAAEERLLKHIDERADKLSDIIKGNQEVVIKQVDQGIKQNLTDSTHLSTSSRDEFQRDLAAEKASLAEEVQKLRAELKASVDELRRFMDNQLKESYPYAFQPRRMDPNVAPSVSDKVPAPAPAPEAK